MDRCGGLGGVTAVGMEGRHIMIMILVETVLITLIGILIGLGIGLAINWYFSTYGLDLSNMTEEDWSLAGTVIDPVLRSHLRPHRVFGLCLAVFLLTVTMGIYPAWKASSSMYSNQVRSSWSGRPHSSSW